MHSLETIETPERDDENVFAVLADQARDRNAAGLWMTTVGGVVNTALIWRQYPGLHWLAAGFAAVAAYGAWALADRALTALRKDSPASVARVGILSTLRAVSIPAGVLAAIVAAAGFMAMALRDFGRMG